MKLRSTVPHQPHLHHPRHVPRLGAGLALLTALSAPAWSQAPKAADEWPTKTVKIIAGATAGPSDITARIFAEALQRHTGQAVIVENRPGAGNNMAAAAAARAEPDGYTLALSPDTVLTVNPLIYKNQGFDARKDLVTASILASFAQMLVCNPSVGVKTAAELVAKSKTSRLTYASGGAGVPGHLAAEMFIRAGGAKMSHVPYRGPAPATMAVLSGEVDCGFLAAPTVLPHVKAGKLNALAVSSATPSPLAPEVPTLSRALDQPGLDASVRLLLQTARGTPAATLARIEKAAMAIMQEPEVRAKLKTTDSVALGTSSAEGEKTMRAEIARWEPLVKELKLQVD